jgi:hypothetical protein
VTKTPYEMWTGKKPTLDYLHLWSCPAEATLFNPSIGKSNPKTVNCHFISYSDKSKGLCFYCPDKYIKIVQTRDTIFLEDEVIRGSTVPQEIQLEEKRVCVPTPMVIEPLFLVPATVTPIVHGNVVVESPVPMAATPIVGSPMAEINKEEEPIFQKPIANHEEEQQQPPI